MMSRLPHYCPVCAYHNWNLDGLVDMIWEYLDLLRIYTKPKVRVGCCSPLLTSASAVPPLDDASGQLVTSGTDGSVLKVGDVHDTPWDCVS